MNAPAIDWDRLGGLIPAIVQDASSGAVLMLGWMNREACERTCSTGRVAFFSRSRQRLWVKGETSGHFLELRSLALDCDADALLVLAVPHGPTCHRGTATCWGEAAPKAAAQDLYFLSQLEGVIEARIAERPEGSYTTRLLQQGTRRIAQKVGEEGLEVALAAVAQGEAATVSEAADLLFHLILLLKVKDLTLAQVVAELRQRHAQRAG
ncbi:MAG: bifunctional phosphoribosyl-AMP cyclohydrolase/phosphoribosyl-ATP diphosphatase HisIE [Proteobacteria bacterium]|nr:bifunctional phosphoribosyl-AMP cyclohydrolase/phosphoribosyl-ATP diphosphatase HisIE [Pseudomonadota bacterium]